MIYGDRLRQARELRGLTQTELASRLGVTQSFVAQVEGGRAHPPGEFMTAVAFQLGFPVSFFEEPPTEDFPEGSLRFRAHASMTDRQQKEIYRYAQTVFDLYKRMVRGRSVREVPLHIPRCAEEPSIAAAIARSELGIPPDVSIPNVINVLEKAGVLVLALPREFEGRDAFSMWAGDGASRRPIIVLSGGKPSDRLRMNIAHELAHLVMHQPVLSSLSKVEEEAKRFAGAFLMPESSMLQEITPPITLDLFANLKPRWGVSIQALILRAHELGIISPRKYRYLLQRLGARGWKLREPRSLEVPLERPRALRQIAELVYGVPIDYARMAADTKMGENFIRRTIEAHAAKSAPRESGAQKTPTAERNGVLIFPSGTKGKPKRRGGHL